MSRRRVMMMLQSAQDIVSRFIDRVALDGGTLDNQVGLSSVDENSSLSILPNAYKDGVIYSVIPEDGTGDFDVVRGSNATRVNASGIIEAITGVNTPRIDYTSGSPLLLVEPQSTNRLTYSEDFSNAYWTKSNSPTINNNISSPDGGNNAYEIESSSASSRIQRNLSTLPAGTYTQSIFVKYGGGDVRMNFKNNKFGGNQHILITSSGVVQETPTSSVSIQEYSGDWHRVSSTYTADGTQSSFLQVFGDIDATNSAYIFGAQIEEQDNSTSYIKTDGASATRLADDISVDLTSLSISSITETIDGVEQTPITIIPSTYTIPQGNINKVVMI